MSVAAGIRSVARLVQAAIIIGLIAAVGWYLWSPGHAVEELVEAAKRDDVPEVEGRVNLDSLRASFVTQLAPDASDKPAGSLARFGDDVAVAVARPVVKAVVTPRMVTTALQAYGETNGTAQSWEIELEGPDSFIMRSADPDQPRPVYRFRRDGLDWLLAEQVLPGNAPR